jgi:poly-gamma-glutamate synthesis protein (capsule biosynthesis protein)
MVLILIALIGVLPASDYVRYEIADVSEVYSEPPPVPAVEEPVTLLFTGDIMLARDVENYIAREGLDYPYRGLLDVLAAPDLTIGNFEGIVPRTHTQTPNMTFQFSVRPEYLAELARVGFDVLSLANNHSHDYGDSALENTRARCSEYGVHCAGAAYVIDETSTFVKQIRNERIGFLFVNTTFVQPSLGVLAERMSLLASESDIQVAYMHWGAEYELEHRSIEREQARALIDAGADVVIGHHPHVVQDIEIYQGKPIYYSLGNFIFDQYFSEDVQVGLMLSMVVHNDHVRYETLPVTTRDTRNQPHPMSDGEARILHDRIYENIYTLSEVSHASGTIMVSRE